MQKYATRGQGTIEAASTAHGAEAGAPLQATVRKSAVVAKRNAGLAVVLRPSARPVSRCRAISWQRGPPSSTE
jgi:hypothetical protein